MCNIFISQPTKMYGEKPALPFIHLHSRKEKSKFKFLLSY